MWYPVAFRVILWHLAPCSPRKTNKTQCTPVNRKTVCRKYGRQVVDGGRCRPVIACDSPCALRGVGVAVFWGDGSGGSSCARMRAEAATGRSAPTAEAEPAADRLRSFAESSAHRQPPAARQSHPATGRRCESAAARMVGGGTHSDRGRNADPPVLPSQSRRTSHDNKPAPCGSVMEPPTPNHAPDLLLATLSTMRPCAQLPTTEPWQYNAEAPVYR